MNRLSGFVLLGLFLLGGWRCSEQMGPKDPSPPFSIVPFRVPEMITVRPGTVYTLAFQVGHPEGWEAIDSVWVEISTSVESPPVAGIALYDDGGALHGNDGDVVARDGIFTNRFAPADLGLEAALYWLNAFARDYTGRIASSEPRRIQATVNSPPVMVGLAVPDTFYAGSAKVIFRATVADSDSVTDVLAVVMEGIQNSVIVFRDTLRRSNRQPQLFQIEYDSSFAAEKLGEYLLEFYALDHQTRSLNTLQTGMFIENDPPVIQWVELPDSVPLPANQELITVRARVVDSQSAADILRVYFKVQLIGSNTSSEVEMYDDGDVEGNGDLVAGDGVFSRIIVLNNTNTPGDYRFRFFALDRVQQSADVVVDTMTVLSN